MHIVTRPRDEAITIKLPDGRIYRVTMQGGEAHVPDDVGRFMIARGYVAAGSAPNPKPQFQRVGDGWGDLIPMFDPWCKEIVPQPDLKENANERSP
jgi:hypothetical protein